MVYSVWCMVYGVWCIAYGVWCMVYGVWCMVYGVRCMVHGVWSMVLEWRMVRGQDGPFCGREDIPPLEQVLLVYQVVRPPVLLGGLGFAKTSVLG